MGTIQEQLLKAQHDSRVLAQKLEDSRAIIDYVAMMTDVEIPVEEAEGGNEDEPEL